MKKALTHTGVFGLFFALSVFNTYPLILSPGSTILNYTSYPWQHDWWFNSWLIFHGVEIIRNLASGSFFYDAFFYPLGAPISLYGQVFFATCVAQPLLKLFPLPVAMNLLILLSLSATGYTAFLLGRHLLKNNLFGFVTGVIFCSSPILIAQAKSHLIVLTTIFAIPLYILFLIKATQDPTLKNALSLSAAAVVLSFGYLYFLNMLFVFTLLFLILKITEKKIGRAQIKYYALSLLLFLPFVALLFPLFIHGSGLTIGVSLSQVRFESVDLLALFLPDVDHPFFGGLVQGIRGRFLNNPILHSAYVGVSILILSFTALKSNFSAVKLWFFSAALFTLLALGPVIHWGGEPVSFGLPPERGYMPYALYHRLFKPLVISDCSMFFILSMLFWSILAGFGIKACARVQNAKIRASLLMGVFCLASLDFLGIPHPLLKIPDSRAFESIIHDPEEVSVLHLPYANDMIIYSYFQCLHGKKILNPTYPRRLKDDFLHYGDNFPTFVSLKQMEHPSPLSRFDLEAAADFQWFFNLKYIVIHKTLLPQRVQGLRDITVDAFNAVPVFEDQSLLLLKLNPVAPAKKVQMSETHIDFDGRERNVILSGWSYLEQDDAGRTYRWADRKQSGMIVKTDHPEETVMRCAIAPFMAPDGQQQSLRVRLNGHDLETAPLSEGWQTHDFHIPASFLRRGHNRFTFSYGYARRPPKKGLRSDPRTLAVAFDSIRFLPQRKD
jgi:hypothetical protein